MTTPLYRRSFLFAMMSFPVAYAAGIGASDMASIRTAIDLLMALEKKSGGRLGVFAFNTANDRSIAYRSEERFPLCSTFKIILVGAILRSSTEDPGLLSRVVHYTDRQLAHYSPITSLHISDGMSISQLCVAALQHSDNTAANLLLNALGGLEPVTAFARSIGNATFRLDRWETALNSALPGDPRDTSTPADMAHSLKALVFGDALPTFQRTQFLDWMRGNTTGTQRISAGLPSPWQTADKTGTGDYGTTNDIAVVWPPSQGPWVVTIYYTQFDVNAPMREDVVASAARIVATTWN